MEFLPHHSPHTFAEWKLSLFNWVWKSWKKMRRYLDSAGNVHLLARRLLIGLFSSWPTSQLVLSQIASVSRIKSFVSFLSELKVCSKFKSFFTLTHIDMPKKTRHEKHSKLETELNRKCMKSDVNFKVTWWHVDGRWLFEWRRSLGMFIRALSILSSMLNLDAHLFQSTTCL